MPANASPIHQRRVQRAVLAIVQSSPGDDLRMIEDRLGVDTDLAKDRLIRTGGIEQVRRAHFRLAGTTGRLKHTLQFASVRMGYPFFGSGEKNRLMPGLKITLPSTTTSSSSRNSCTARLRTCPSSSRPLRFTSSSPSTPTLMWKT